MTDEYCKYYNNGHCTKGLRGTKCDLNGCVAHTFMKPKELQLPLKGKWFRMIESGEKKEEYREINEYWTKRMHTCTEDCCDAHKDGSCLKTCKAAYIHLNHIYNGNRTGPYTHVHFTLGYPRKDDASRHMVKRIKEITIGTGRPEWGAEPGKEYFVIKFDD